MTSRTATVRSGHPHRRRRPAFTLIEVAVAAVIFLTLMGVVFQMYTKGSKAGAKATWRAQVTGKSRAALRRIKEAVDGTSYPSVVSFTNYMETTPSYGFQLQAATSSSVAGTVTTYTYEDVGDAVRFFACFPAMPAVMAPPTGIPNGQIAEYVLGLEDSAMYGSRRRDLRMTISTGTITDGGNSVTIGSLQQVDSRVIASEIERLEITIPTGGSNGNSVVAFRLVSRDPIDGFMRLVEESRANVNTAISAP